MVPRKVSSYMLLTGIPIDAEDALRSGLVSRLSEDDETLEREIDTVCEAIAIKPKKVVELGKAFYRKQIEMGKYFFVTFMEKYIVVVYIHQLSLGKVGGFHLECFRPFRRPQRRREGHGGELAIRGCTGRALCLQRKEEAKMDAHR